MKKVIEIKDDGNFTERQKMKLACLDFVADGPAPATWTYRAMDLQDLVSTVEDLQEIEGLQDIPYKLKTQE